MKQEIFENGIFYKLGDDGIYYPNLKLPEDTNFEIGKFGRMRAKHIWENDKRIYYEMLAEGKWNSYLHEIDEECNRQMEILVKSMMEQDGVTEKLKKKNQMEWVRKVEGIRLIAEAVVVREWVYV